MTRKQVHVYLTDELDEHLLIMAGDLGLSASAFLVMLVSKAWNERKGGSLASVSESLVEVPVSVAVVQRRYKHKSRSK